MAKSDARFEYKANLGRTDFDLSQRLGLTSAAGMLLPIWFDFANAGDSYYIQHDLPLLRSSVLAQPAMIDCKVHYDTFFVPMQMIYQPFEQTLYSLKDFQSSFYEYINSPLLNNNFPVFDYSDFVTNVIGVSNPNNDYHADAFRLADLFGLCPDNFYVASLQSKYSPNFFPWQLLAYHTIYQYYYRLDDKSQFENSYCNWDKYYNASSPVKMIRDFMMIHQRPWDFDYFTSLYRSPIVSADNVQLMQNIGNNPLTNAISFGANLAGAGVGDTGNNNIANYRISANMDPAIAGLNTAAIRQMFANEKLAMITGRTRKNYDSQVLAHIGINVPHDVKHDLTMIHHDEFDLRVQEVTSLSASSSEPLGEMAGKSYAAGNGQQFKFTAPVHGVIMTILSVEPKKRYFGGFDKINAVTSAFDFPTPEYDRLGNQPMFRYECGFMPGAPGSEDSRDNSDIVGWKERYYANKRKYDKCTFAFGYTNQSQYVNNWSAYMLAFRPFATNWDNNNAPDQRPDLEGRFYIERNAMDSVCVVPFAYGWLHDPDGEDWNNTPWLAYQRDPFIINSFVKAKKVSWMSKDGEPIYNY